MKISKPFLLYELTLLTSSVVFLFIAMLISDNFWNIFVYEDLLSRRTTSEFFHIIDFIPACLLTFLVANILFWTIKKIKENERGGLTI